MLLSIVIPVYNVEKYIHNTLQSIYEQNADSSTYEVIVVNDGTPDNSMEIVHEYAKNHSNLHVIDQKNEGLSCARNAGFNVAKGDYVWFMDSDDSLVEDSLLYLNKYLHIYDNIEIYAFDMYMINELTKEKSVQKYVLKRNHEYLYDSISKGVELSRKCHIAPVQRFVFSTKFLHDNKLYFYPNIYHEDLEFMTHALLYAKKVLILKKCIFYYLVRTSGSIMSNYNIKRTQDKELILKNVESLLFRHNNTRKDIRFIKDMMLYCWCSILQESSMHLDEKHIEIIYKKFKAQKKACLDLLFPFTFNAGRIRDVVKCLLSN